MANSRQIHDRSAERLFETNESLDVDVLVIGGGMGGMAAAASAAKAGLTVLVVDRSPQIGGSAALSEGFVWTAPTLDVLFAEDPRADPALARALVDGLRGGLDWVASLGVHVGPLLEGIMNFGVGRQIDVHAFLRIARAAVEAAGGWVVTNAETRELLVVDRRVVGARIAQGDADEVLVRAPWTVLATGGFQANSALVREHIRSSWDPVLLRSNVYSTGGGLALATAVGAALTPHMGGFYGHLMPSPITRPLTHTDYTALAQYHSEHAVLLDRHGRRFVDESNGDHVSNQAVATTDGERALLVCDEWVRQNHILKAFIPGMDQGLDKGELAADAGAAHWTADTIQELVDAVGAWTSDPQQMRRTLEDFNRKLASGDGDALAVPRARHRRPLDRPPYVALEVQPALTFTNGGLRTDADMRVLDGDDEPIPGLLAAGVDVGGVAVEGYFGGLSRGLVFGIRAAREAARQRERRPAAS